MSSQIDRPTLIRSFNDYFIEFLEDILKVLPENKSIMTATKSFKTLIEINKTILIKSWYKFVYAKYKNELENGDVEFFFNKDYAEDLTALSNSQHIMDIIDSVRGPAREVCENPKNKEYIFTYIINLCKVSELFNVGNFS